MLGLIKRSFNHMDKEMFLILHKSLIRPYLEYGSAIWSIPYKKESTKLENMYTKNNKNSIRDEEQIIHGQPDSDR